RLVQEVRSDIRADGKEPPFRTWLLLHRVAHGVPPTGVRAPGDHPRVARLGKVLLPALLLERQMHALVLDRRDPPGRAVRPGLVLAVHRTAVATHLDLHRRVGNPRDSRVLLYDLVEEELH